MTTTPKDTGRAMAPTSWEAIAEARLRLAQKAIEQRNTALRQLDEARKALEPLAATFNRIPLKTRKWATDDTLIDVEYQHLVRAFVALSTLSPAGSEK